MVIKNIGDNVHWIFKRKPYKKIPKKNNEMPLNSKIPSAF